MLKEGTTETTKMRCKPTNYGCSARYRATIDHVKSHVACVYAYDVVRATVPHAFIHKILENSGV